MENSEQQFSRAKRRRAWIWGVAATIAIAITASACYVAVVNPLPSDEEMIAHFQAHRAEMEALVKRYREYQLPAGEKPRYWAAAPETEALMQKAGIKYVNQVGALWLPNPYSIETARQKDAMVRSKQDFEIGRRYGALYVRPADQRYFTKLLRYPTSKAIWKDFYQIPETPKIENGALLGPMNVDGTSNPHYRVFASLNSYPPAWKRGECVMRQLDAHWFIQMCRAA